ncbi:hypothetical protein KNU35_gp209 [Escherichia phage vB_EcoM_005]|uniref:Uncharacterized protein n=1 Tax=Escherichia phage vB_EcoM_005 TaxID=2500761 RepID=A0A3T0ILX6_9CAUD|nr:hypothetical protein KNU35_gp209 [Escherichia phage vB_EcoM_005]AZV01022.1 hypothetical protein vBEcoM005_135 [Escherichia phage vB_EcoM_005]
MANFVLEPETLAGSGDDMTVEVVEWNLIKGGIVLEQDDEVIYLDASQVEELYSILKHNR